VLQRPPDGGEQLLQRDRLLEEIVGADAGCLDRGIDRAVTGHHHHRHGEQSRARPLLQQRDAGGIRHPDVEQHQVGTRLAAERARGRRVLGEAHLVALVGEDLREQLADADFVVYDQDLLHGREDVLSS
jgi:hypothetical protein